MRLRGALAIVARRGRAAAGDRRRLRQLRHAVLAGVGPAARARPDAELQACALAPTPHPLLEALGVILAPLGAAATHRDRRRARLPRARVRSATSSSVLGSRLVLLAGRARGGGADPEPLRGSQLRRARLRRHPLRRARAGGAGARDAPPARRLAGDRAARPRRAAAPRGVAVRRPSTGCTCGAASTPRERLRARRPRRASRRCCGSLWDLAVTGNPLWSLTNTRATAKQLRRATGLLNVPYYGRAPARRGARPGRPRGRGRRRRARAVADARARDARRSRRR